MEAGFRIRPMTIGDYDEVRALWLRCHGMGLNDVDDSRAGIARLLARNPETCLVAVGETLAPDAAPEPAFALSTEHESAVTALPGSGPGPAPSPVPESAPKPATELAPERISASGPVLGCILVGTDGRRAYVYHTAVDPSARGRGIGRALVEASLQALRRLRVSKVALVAFARNQQGNAFWERMGFRQRHDLAYRDLALVRMVRTDT